ncbi:hypothetical protein P9112_005847 [Eukaryota sp. TZLM1-RC]
MEPGSEPPAAFSKSNLIPQKGSKMGPPRSLPKNANVGSSSTVPQGYEKLQSVLDKSDDEEKGLRHQIMKDAEAHLESTDYCLFEQLPPLWKQIAKRGRNETLIEFKRTDVASCPLKEMVFSSEVTRTDPVPSPLTKEAEPRRVRAGHDNGLGSLSPP